MRDLELWGALMPHVGPRVLAGWFAALGITGLVYLLTSGAFPQWRAEQLPFDDLLFYIALPFTA